MNGQKLTERGATTIKWTEREGRPKKRERSKSGQKVKKNGEKDETG